MIPSFTEVIVDVDFKITVFDTNNLEEWLQRIHYEVQGLQASMTRSEKATRSFLTSWFEESQDKEDTCFPTSTCNPLH